MSLDNDYEHIRGQLLNHSHCPSLNTAVNELVGEETRLATLQAQNKLKFWLLLLLLPPQSNYCKRLGYTIKTCYHCNKSTTTVTNTESTPPMFFVSIESQSSGSTINLSSTEPQDIIAQVIHMAGYASLSTALLVVPGRSYS